MTNRDARPRRFPIGRNRRWITPLGTRWLIGTSPVLVLLLLFALKTLSMVGVNDAGIRAYDEGRFSASHRIFSQLHFINVFEPWIAAYNRGTAEYGLRDFGAARESFTTALEQAPAEYECRVLLNLVSTIERQADELATQRQHAEALKHYELALRMLADANCGELTHSQSPSPSPSDSPSVSESPSPSQSQSPSESPSSGPSGEPSPNPSGEPSSIPSGGPSSQPEGEPDQQGAEDRQREEADRKQQQQERISEKADEQRQQAERESRDPEPSVDPEASPEPESDPAGQQQRQEQLEQRNQEGQREQNRHRDRDSRPTERVETPW